MMIVYRTALLVLLLMFTSTNLMASQGGLSLRNALPQSWVSGLSTLFIGGVLWFGGSGCERSEPIIKPVASVLQAEGRATITKNVTITVGGDTYDGVVGVAENGLILAEIDDDGLTLVFLEYSDDFVGFAVPDHNNIGRKVYVLLTQPDDRVTRVEGTVKNVFHNGYLQIEVEYEFYLDDYTVVSPFTTANVIAYELLLLKGEQAGFID